MVGEGVDDVCESLREREPGVQRVVRLLVESLARLTDAGERAGPRYVFLRQCEGERLHVWRGRRDVAAELSGKQPQLGGGGGGLDVRGEKATGALPHGLDVERVLALVLGGWWLDGTLRHVGAPISVSHAREV